MGREVCKRSGCGWCVTAHLDEFVPAPRRIIEDWEEEEDKAADMLTKVNKPYQEARARVVLQRSVDVFELINGAH